MLLHIDGKVVEIRPSELFESRSEVSSRYLELVKAPIKQEQKPRRKKTFKLDVSSSPES
ncbi:hypothetical protein N8467_01305 [bacterium]|jgi:hypothetical protein|nr:hypothetical protein [bacterium]